MNKTKIISVANHKGGVGKTTTVTSVGVGLARRGFKVLLVDLDAQANLTSSLLEEEPPMTLYDTLIEGHELSIVHVMENVDIIPSSLDLSSDELELSTKMDREYILLELLEEVKREYDYIIIDCPPSLGLLTINALVASTDLYIPMTAEVLPTRGMNTLIRSIEMVKKRANKELKLSGIIFTRWHGRNLNKALENQLRKQFGNIIFETKIRENISVAEAPLSSTDIYTYNPKCNGAKDYGSLVEEIIKRG